MNKRRGTPPKQTYARKFIKESVKLLGKKSGVTIARRTVKPRPRASSSK